MRKQIFVSAVLLISLPFYSFAFAETVLLKSGQKIEGDILEKTDKQIKINMNGVPVTCLLSDVASIGDVSYSGTNSAKAGPEEQLNAMIMATASRDFIKEWMGASYSHAPRAAVINEVGRNQTFYVAVIVNGYGVGEKGRIDLVGNLVFSGPDGKVLFEDKDNFKIKVAEGGRAGGFLMLNATFDMTLEDSDPLGVYTIRAVVSDNILGRTTTAEHKINLKEEVKTSAPPVVFDSEKSFSKWMTYYYIQPEPEKISAAVRYYSDSSLFNKVNARLSMASFFAALFRNDGGLMKKTYVDINANSSANAKSVFLMAVWLANTAEGKELGSKARIDWKIGKTNKQIPNLFDTRPPDILNDPVENAAQLDMLWAEFMATGDSAPVKRIISALHLLKDGKGADMAIGGAAQWSLGSNIMQHQRVSQICREEAANTDPETRKILEEILAKAK